MNPDSRLSKLITEEVKATKLYLWLFYIIFIAYDIFYFYIIPMSTNDEIGLPSDGMGYWLYLFVFGFLPIAIYYLKSSKPYVVKYFLFFCYNLLDFINSLMLYVGTDNKFASGNIVELFFILFSSIFISKKFFWFVSWIIIFKYVFYASILHDANLILGIVILAILAGISYIFLSRFNSYINTLEIVNDDLRQKEKLALVGQLATSIGHEIRNPLSSLKGFTQLQKEKYPNDGEYYKIMINEIDRINSIVNDLMSIGKPRIAEFKKQNINEIINFVVTMINQEANSTNISINNKMGSVQEINCDPNQLKQVFINLIKNAIESMPNGGNINITSKVIKKKQLVIFIEDEGLGIDEQKLAMLGQPFYTTKKDGNGLGLMITFNIIEQHKGKILFKSALEKGTIVEIYLPI